MSRVELIVAPNLNGATRWVAERIATVAESIVTDSGACSLLVAGGATPRSLYELLSSPLWRARMDWSPVSVYMGDERYVPPNDPRSNFRMLRETLLDRILIPPRNVRPIPTSAGNPDRDAEIFAELLRKTLPQSEDGVPQVDLALLGLGPDGHTASLFPGSRAIRETERLVVAVRPPDAPTPRITVTAPLLNAAREVVILTAGTLKAGALLRVLARDGTPESIPARLVDPVSGRFEIVTDLEACERLDEEPLRDGIVTIRL